MTEEQSDKIISLLTLIHQELESISSHTSGTETYVMNLESKLDDIEKSLKS
ncbi:hypothetical protein [Lentibacillus jeotgali]|uniref:hypothetical protein n=1 Tax=Lentibacillus jeotgali TaxID=558169 RepID=UPI0015849AE2|nr:hypothetical protein [Lentibacillus jeotgali]